MKRFFSKQTWIIWITALAVAAGLGAAMYDYLGPDRTVTESSVETYDYGVWAKPNYIDPATGECACKKAGQPNVCADGCIICSWERAPGNACGDATYWYKLGTQSEVVTTTRTYPEASISAALQSCALHNGWCATSPFLSLTANEPVAGYQILLLEGTRNGELFACASASCTIPLLEGENIFTYWALSDWGDSSRMGNLSARVDTQPPQIDGAMSGTPGEAGWYVSPVTFSASASDPEPASGIQAFSYALGGGAWSAYTAPVIVNDGAHSITFRAQDAAGHIAEISQAVQVDTLPPQVAGALSGEQVNDWYLSQVMFSASAVDTGSGVAQIEYNLDGGAWQSYTVPVTIGDGIHSLRTRAFDVAGNAAEGETLSFQVDGSSPRIQLTESWHIWESGSLQVNDGGSGLASVEIEIRDPQGRWQKVSQVHEANGQAFSTGITWNRKFADGTIAPIGTYQVVIKASDQAGNMSSETASIFIPAPNAPTYTPAPTRTLAAPPTATDIGAVVLAPTLTITATRTPVVSTFGLVPAVVSNPQASSPSPSSGQDLWGAAALAAISGVTAYALEQQRQRKEEEARQAAQAAQKAASLNAAAAQAKIENYLQGQAMLNEALANSGLSEAEKAAIRAQAQANGMAAGLGLTAATVAAHQQAKREADIAWLEKAEETEQDRHAKHIKSDEYKAYQSGLLAWHEEQAKLTSTPGKGPGLASLVSPNETPDETSSVWRFLREYDGEGSLVFGPGAHPIIGTPTSTTIPFNPVGDMLTAKAIQFYPNNLPAEVKEILSKDGINTNCTRFTNAVLMSVYKELGLPYIPFSEFGDFGKTAQSQKFYSAQNGEIRFVVNGNSHSQSEILQELQRLSNGALVPGATIYTKTTELYLGTPFVHGDFGHSVLYIGNGQILEMSGPSYWAKNEQGQYIGEGNNGSDFYIYNWLPNSSDPIIQRSLFDITSSPTETLVKGVPGSSFPNNFTVQRLTSEISIVPAQPVNIEDLPNYGINNFDTWEQILPQNEYTFWAGDKGKTCYLNPATKDMPLQQLYCSPTVPPSATPTPTP